MDTNKKGLSAWQLTMMTIGSVIGGSFFVGSSIAIKAAGPSVLITYILGGALVYFILFAISEMTVANPDTGSFRTFAAEAFGQGTGFVVGWVYWAGLTLGLSSEATAISILLSAWIPKIPIAVIGCGITILITLINLLGTEKISKLESGLTFIKLFAIVSFIVIAFLLIFGLYPSKPAIGTGSFGQEEFMPGGIFGLAGSMLIVLFAYSGFEVIGLTASEANNPTKTIPKAIRRTVVILVSLYIISAAALLPLVPTSEIVGGSSPMVSALNLQGIRWAGLVLNIVLITAILSTMIASVFGLGRIILSLAEENLAPKWLKDKADVPYRGILFTGIAMLAGLAIGFLFEKVYIFLVSSGGFAMIFTYAVIMATHIKFRKKNGCPPHGNCQLWGFPYTSAIVTVFLVITIISMPFVEGQETGLIAGCILVAVFSVIYLVIKIRSREYKRGNVYIRAKDNYIFEISEELTDDEND